MKIILSWPGRSRAWHVSLRRRLAAIGHEFSLGGDASAPSDEVALRFALAMERRLYGARAASLVAEPMTRHAGRADLVLSILFDGAEGEAALLDAIIRRRAPFVRVRGRRDGAWADLAEGRPANEEPLVLSRGIDQVTARVVAMVCRAVRESADARWTIGAEPVPSMVRRPASAAIFLARGLVRKVADRVLRRRHRWSIVLRNEGRTLTLAADERRYVADPFLFRHEGRMHLLFEEFVHATGKGVIAHVAIDDGGGMSESRVVLEEPFHLSYPVVVAHAGAIYMLPEMGAAGRIQFYRAESFPDRWVPDVVAVDDIVAGDATPIRHDGRWWLFATVSGDGGSSWDQLCLFHADDLLGPWTPHPRNPVLIDAGAARPAGAMWHEDGVLMRVAQDCRVRYGGGLALCRVDRLDDGGYAQTVVERIAPPPGATGLHTRNRLGGFEALDIERRAR